MYKLNTDYIKRAVEQAEVFNRVAQIVACERHQQFLVQSTVVLDKEIVVALRIGDDVKRERVTYEQISDYMFEHAVKLPGGVE